MSSDETPTDETPTDETPDSDDHERTVIRRGRDFEQEYRLSAADAGEFLIRLGEQLRDDEELTLVDESGDETWELPFAFGEPVELELDYEGMGEPELEIEVEIPGKTGDEAPEVR